jgi:hypothetical protein
MSSEALEALKTRIAAAEEHAKTSPVQVYAHGMFCASVCAPGDMTGPEVAAEAERCSPSGTEGGWMVSSDTTFKGGQPMPCVCEHDASRKHWLLDA